MTTMQRLFAVLLFIFVNKSYSQKIFTPNSVPELFSGKCFWAYSIERIQTLKDSTHHYNISFSLCQCDSSKIASAKIRCEYIDNGKPVKVYFIAENDHWTADFIIHATQPLDIKIIAEYNKHKRIMKATLNNGLYPGERD